MRLHPILFFAAAYLVLGTACTKTKTSQDRPTAARNQSPTTPAHKEGEPGHMEGHDHDKGPAPKVTLPANGLMGSALTLKEETPLDKFVAAPKSFEGKTVRVSGKVVAFCSHRRAWLALGDAQGKPVVMVQTAPRFLVPDGVMGNRVVTEGKVTIKTFPKDMAAHLAKEHGWFGGDPKAVDGPRTLPTIMATGARFETAGQSAPKLGKFPPAPKASVVKLASGINTFALDLYRVVAKGQTGNLFFSPWSISMALAMTHLGARGTTAAEMEKVLHFPKEHLDDAFGTVLRNLTSHQSKGFVLEIANRIFPAKRYKLLPKFAKALALYYATTVQPVLYAKAAAAVATINAWVKAKTKGRIPNLLAPSDVDSLTKLVLVNTIFFKGSWKTKFDKKKTREMPFFSSATKKVQAHMMHATMKARYASGPDYQMLALPYDGKRLSMVVVLPKDKQGLGKLEKKLTAGFLDKAIRKMARRKVKIWLPKFHAQQKLRLKTALQALGMKLPFDKTKADFSGISSMQPGLYISAVIHEANCDVDEEGTVAAAATAVVMKLRGRAPMVNQTPVFKADHPFLFFIRDNESGAILFLGRIVKP